MKQLKLTFLLSVLMSMVGAEALAYNFKVDGICYDFYDGSSVEVAANSQYSGNIVIPSTVDYNGKTYNVVRIGYRAFAETYHLESITIPLSVTSIGDYAFSGSLITAIDIPSSVVRIGDYVFNKCKNLTSITIPSSVRVIGEGVFCECQCLTRIVVDSGNTIYDSRNNCNAVVETGTNTIVHGCCRTIIPNSVTAIGDYAFIGCQGLRSIEIPSSVINIGSMAFHDCTALTSVKIGCIEPIAISNYTFSNRTNATLYVPVGCKTAYEAADYWKEFKEIVEFEKFTLEIQDDRGVLSEMHLYDENGNEYDKDEYQSTFDLNEGSYVRIVPKVYPFEYIREIIVNGTSVGIWTDENIAPTEYVIESLTENMVVEFKRYLNEQNRTLYCDAEGPGKIEMYRNGNYVGTTTTQNPISSEHSLWTEVFEEGDVLKLVFIPDDGCTLSQFICGQENPLYGGIGVDLIGDVKDNTYSLTFPSGGGYDMLLRFFIGYFEGPEPSTSNILSAAAPTILTGNTSALSLGLTNEDEIIMTEFYMQLPEGITIEEDEDGYPLVTLNSERDNNHVLEVSRNSNGDYHFLCYSSKNNAFKGNDGEVFNMNLVCAEGVAAGTYQATVKDIIMSDIGRNELTQGDFTFDITVMDVAMGDANCDGRINGMDIVEMVDYIMERPSDGFLFVAADITGDGKVNGMDLVELVSLVMAQGAASPQPSPKGKGVQKAASIESGLNLTSGDDGELKLGVEMPGEFILAQMIVEVGNGRLIDVTTDMKHEVVWSEIGAGRYAVLAYSAKNRSFTANDCLLTFHCNAENISVKDVMLVDANRDAKYFADVAYNGTTGIESLTPDFGLTDDRSFYSLSGQRISVSSSSTVLPKGVYIVNGKKVIVK